MLPLVVGLWLLHSSVYKGFNLTLLLFMLEILTGIPTEYIHTLKIYQRVKCKVKWTQALLKLNSKQTIYKQTKF